MSKLTKLIRQLAHPTSAPAPIPVAEVTTLLERIMMLQSRCEAMRRSAAPAPPDLATLEYCVYSQFGDDGIIEYLTGLVPPHCRTFVEFGVESYQESNTRLLIERDNWSGLVIDGCDAYVQFIRQQRWVLAFDLTAVSAFLTRDNVNGVFADNGFVGDIGLLSIDIDGNDYWMWEAITVVNPLIVVCEYNAIFGPRACVSIPYDPAFDRRQAHWSFLYAGASLNALNHLAKQKGYRFLGCNLAGNNAYFVHESFDPGIPFPSVEQGFVRSKFREARNPQGQMLQKRADQCLHLIAHMPVVDVRTGQTLTVADCVAADQAEPFALSNQSEAA